MVYKDFSCNLYIYSIVLSFLLDKGFYLVKTLIRRMTLERIWLSVIWRRPRTKAVFGSRFYCIAAGKHKDRCKFPVLNVLPVGLSYLVQIISLCLSKKARQAYGSKLVRQGSFLPRKNSRRAIDVPVTTGSKTPASPRQDGPLDETLAKYPNDNRSRGATYAIDLIYSSDT